MEVPIEIIYIAFGLMGLMSVIGVLKKNPALMFIGGAIITFLFLLTDSITGLGDTETCTTTLPSTTTCEVQPYVLDTWVQIIFMLLGAMIMIGGVLIWKAMDE